jgi:hypothetical protein
MCGTRLTQSLRNKAKNTIKRSCYLKEENQDQSIVSPRGIYGRQSGTGTDFTLNTLV